MANPLPILQNLKLLILLTGLHRLDAQQDFFIPIGFSFAQVGEKMIVCQK